jgi:murein DD-endopeptidase MepM/ murein hydrolase activator NlpD
MVDFIKWTLAAIVTILILGGIMLGASYIKLRDSGFVEFVQYKQDPDSVDLPVNTGLEQCAGAPFINPTGGWIGIMYGDSIFGVQNHSGLDIFGLEGNGVTPVYAAYDGYLTRLPEWTSAIIIRHPEDPLMPGRQIWTYYTHLADSTGNSYIIDQIPPGTFELPVKQGTLLGYQGDYNGGSLRQIDTHLHFSIVLDDGNGNFRNETDLANTLDPSPYLGMRLNTTCADRPPVCRPDFFCP